MKKILLATAAIFAMASSASALDFGNGLALDTELVTEYNTDTSTVTSVLTPRLGYAPVEGLAIWAETDLSIYDGSLEVITLTGRIWQAVPLARV